MRTSAASTCWATPYDRWQLSFPRLPFQKTSCARLVTSVLFVLAESCRQFVLISRLSQYPLPDITKAVFACCSSPVHSSWFSDDNPHALPAFLLTLSLEALTSKSLNGEHLCTNHDPIQLTSTSKLSGIVQPNCVSDSAQMVLPHVVPSLLTMHFF